MYILEELNETYYNFLLREVVPRARELGFYSADTQLEEKIAFLELLEIEELLFFNDDNLVRAPIRDCPKCEIHLAACQAESEARMYIQEYRDARKKAEAKKPRTLQLEFTPVDLARNLNAPQQQGMERMPEDAAYAHSRK